MKRTLLILAGWQFIHDLRPLAVAGMFRWLPAELRDGHAARVSVDAALAQDGPAAA